MLEFEYNITRPEHLERGQETAKWVLDVITTHPELHDQDWWGAMGMGETDTVVTCGTTHCTGGWAVWAHGGHDEYDYESVSIAVRAAYLLKISPEDAEILFYRATNEDAVRALTMLAKGREIDWSEAAPDADFSDVLVGDFWGEY